jgi:hypothetical protein
MWNIPSAVSNILIFNTVIKLNSIKPGLVSGTYDCYSLLKWMGGRPFRSMPQITPKTYIDRIKALNKNDIGCYHVYTNQEIQKKDLNDYWPNFFLEHSHNELNGVICSNPILVEYIRKNFPKFKILGSSIHQQKTLDRLKELQSIYDILIIPPDINKKIDIIGQLDTSKIEIMVSEGCTPNCPSKKRHYQLTDRWNMTHDIDDFTKIIDFYREQKTCNVIRKTTNNLYINKKELDVFKQMGVNLFKLQERDLPYIILNNIMRFVIIYSDYNLIDKYKLFNCIPMRGKIFKKFLFD